MHLRAGFFKGFFKVF